MNRLISRTIHNYEYYDLCVCSVAGQTSAEVDGARIDQLSAFYIGQWRLDVR